MVNVFSESAGNRPGNLQLVKKVITTVGQHKDFYAEIQQSHMLGFPPYQLHTNVDRTFVTPIRYYDGRVYVLDDVAMLDVSCRHIAMDKLGSELIYFVEGDDGRGVALQGDCWPLWS